MNKKERQKIQQQLISNCNVLESNLARSIIRFDSTQQTEQDKKNLQRQIREFSIAMENRNDMLLCCEFITQEQWQKQREILRSITCHYVHTVNVRYCIDLETYLN